MDTGRTRKALAGDPGSVGLAEGVSGVLAADVCAAELDLRAGRRGTNAQAGLGAGLSGASMAVASRLTWPTTLGPAWVLTMCSWICWGTWSLAKAVKARLKVASLGTSPALSQPQRDRRRGRHWSASSSAVVFGN